jgi:hypothetical protein
VGVRDMEETKDLLVVTFADDGKWDIQLSEDFLSSSLEDQLQALEAFYWRKNLEPSSTLEVNSEMTEHEFTLVVTECLITKLKRGERLGNDTDIEISLDEFMGSDDSLFC